MTRSANDLLLPAQNLSQESDFVVFHNEPVSEEEKAAHPERASCCTKTIMIFLGGAGACAGVLYWNAAGECVLSETCGKSIVDFFIKYLAFSAESALDAAKWLLVLSGAVGYSGSNMVFAFFFYAAFREYLALQKTTQDKLVKGFLVIANGIVQTAQNFLSVLATGGQILSLPMALTVGGALPGNLYGSTGMIKNTLPSLYAKLKSLKDDMYYVAFSPKTQAELLERNRVKYYRRQQELFIQQAEANFKQLVASARNLRIPPISSLDYLFQQKASIQIEPSLVRFSNHIIKLGGIGISLNFIYPIGKGAFDVLSRYVPFLGLQLATTALLTSALAYSGFKYTVEGIEKTYKHLKNTLQRRPFDSLAYQLRPKTMVLATTLCTTISIASYAVVNMLWDSGYHGPAKDELRHSARASIGIYHAYALIVFCIEMLTKLTRDPAAKALFKIEQDVARVKMESLNDFIKFVESTDEEKRQLYGIQTYQESITQHQAIELVVSEEKTIVSNQEVPQEEVISASAALVPQRKPQRTNWCSWLTGRYVVDDENDDDANDLAAIQPQQNNVAYSPLRPK